MQNETPENRRSITDDPWASLRSFTAARIALGRTGTAIPLQRSLDFRMAHAYARDAVYSALDTGALQQALAVTGKPVFVLQSQATNRQMYLQRPDLGRRLQESSVQQLTACNDQKADISIILADGLSASAVNAHAVPVVRILLEQWKRHTLAPVCLVQQARVAVGDEVGSLLHAAMAVVLIGERPGLSAPDSMGAYLTFRPRPGLTDESRNCISNIRPGGLGYEAAANKIISLVSAAFRLQLTGTALKDSDEPEGLGR